jgi:hypothetical protein
MLALEALYSRKGNDHPHQPKTLAIHANVGKVVE